MSSVRINIRRLIMGILVTLVLPLALAILMDYTLGWAPFATIGASLFFIPLSTVVVTRATLSELDKVIQKVAPLDYESGLEEKGLVEQNSMLTNPTFESAPTNQLSINRDMSPCNENSAMETVS